MVHCYRGILPGPSEDMEDMQCVCVCVCVCVSACTICDHFQDHHTVQSLINSAKLFFDMFNWQTTMGCYNERNQEDTYSNDTWQENKWQ